jgi:hypothetical protein
VTYTKRTVSSIWFQVHENKSLRAFRGLITNWKCTINFKAYKNDTDLEFHPKNMNADFHKWTWVTSNRVSLLRTTCISIVIYQTEWSTVSGIWSNDLCWFVVSYRASFSRWCEKQSSTSWLAPKQHIPEVCMWFVQLYLKRSATRQACITSQKKHPKKLFYMRSILS